VGPDQQQQPLQPQQVLRGAETGGGQQQEDVMNSDDCSLNSKGYSSKKNVNYNNDIMCIPNNNYNNIIPVKMTVHMKD
jgi:hypothetical protein